MKRTMFCLLAVAAAPFAGCSSGQEPAPKPPEKTVFDSLIQTEQRARDVQKTLDESASQARQSVAAQERGDPAP
ncbi:MAG: hypothetical protein ACHQIL_00635 [Steroidobacterales bacterium]